MEGHAEFRAQSAVNGDFSHFFPELLVCLLSPVVFNCLPVPLQGKGLT